MAALSSRTGPCISGRCSRRALPVQPFHQQHSTVAARQTSVVAHAEGRNGDGSFLAGFVFGGVVMGTLGFVFAPQISKALLGDDQRLKLPRFMEDEQPKDPEQTKQDLIEKIAQLNASIDEVASQLKGKEEITSKIDSDGIRIA